MNGGFTSKIYPIPYRKRGLKRYTLLTVAKEAIEHLDEEVDALEKAEFVIGHIHAERKEESSVSPVYDFVRSKLQTDNRTQR